MGDCTFPMSSLSAHREYWILPRRRAPVTGAAQIFCNFNKKLRQFWGRYHSQKPLHGFVQGDQPRGEATLQPVMFRRHRCESCIPNIASGG